MILKNYARFKNYLLLLMLLALASPSIELLADQEYRQQEITKQEITQNDQNTDEEFFDEELSTWRKGLHWGVAASGLVRDGAMGTIMYFFSENFCRDLEEKPLSQETKVHIQEIIHSFNNSYPINPDTIIVKGTDYCSPSPAGTLGKKVLLVDPNKIQNLTKAELEFVVAHELGHFKNKDSLKKTALLLMLPFIAHYGLKAWDAGVHKLLSGIKSTLGLEKDSRTAKMISKIDYINHWLSTFCITKYVVAWQIFKAYSRYCENQADFAAISHIKTSEGAESFFKKFQEENKTIRETKPLETWRYNEQGDTIFPGTHPRPSERIANTRAWAQAYPKAAPVIIETPVIAQVEVIPTSPVVVPTN